MSRPCAPTAMRMPISRVRSVTLTSMMFMMPMPPTTSETPAMAPSRPVITSAVAVAVVGDFLLVADGEIVVAPAADVVTLAQQRDDLLLRRSQIVRTGHLRR